MSKSLIGKSSQVFPVLAPNLPNEAGGPMSTNSPTKKGQGGGSNVHNGDNNTGVNIENMNFQRGDNGGDAVRSINQQGMAVAGQWLNRQATRNGKWPGARARGHLLWLG